MKYRGRDRMARPGRPPAWLFLLAGLAAATACHDTGSEPQGTLEITAVSPADGASAVPVTDAVVLTFSQPVDDGSVADAFLLDDDGRIYRGGLALPTARTPQSGAGEHEQPKAHSRLETAPRSGAIGRLPSCDIPVCRETAEFPPDL